MLASLVFLTPLGGLAMLALVLPLGGLALAARRERQARVLLKLPAPPRISNVRRAAALVAVPLLLGFAATQPALRSLKSAHVRTDAQAFFVFDISRSMLASRTATSPTRLARAKLDALQLRDAIPQVPAGIATLTDRVLPDLFPNPDRNVFDETLNRSVTIEEPPPQSSNVVATSLGAIASLGTQNFFDRSARRRLVVLLTDGEEGTGAPYDPTSIAHDLATGPGIHLVIVHVWAADERVFDSGGFAEQGYHVHPESSHTVAALAAAAGGSAFAETSIASATHAVRAALGSGPTIVQGRTEQTRTLAPYVALLALLPLLLVLPRVGRGLGAALRAFRPATSLKQIAGASLGRARAVLRPTGLGIGLCLALLLAGCGSSSKQSYPSLGSQATPETPPVAGQTPGWETLSGNTYGPGSTKATVSVAAINPVRLKLQVNASPDVVTETSYEVHCDQLSTRGQPKRETTPLTREVAIPRGGKAGSSTYVECFVTANATKPASASMTLTLLQRLPTKTPAHG